MKHIKLLHIFLICSFLIVNITSVFSQGDMPDGISTAIKNGNSSALSKYFNTKIELTINNRDEIYSREQAGLIIKDFFANHVPNNFVILHKGGKEGARYAIGSLTTSNEEYRVTILLKVIDNQSYIHQLRIEKENGQ